MRPENPDRRDGDSPHPYLARGTDASAEPVPPGFDSFYPFADPTKDAQPTLEADDSDIGAEGVDTPGQGRSQWRNPWAVALVSALVSALLTSAVWAGVLTMRKGEAVQAGSGQAASIEPLLDVGDGVDPMRTICRQDAVIAASEPRLGGDVQVQVLYSNHCTAAWGRVTRYDGKSFGNSLEMVVYPAANIESSRTQIRRAHDVQSLYTTMLIEPDVEARVCAVATVTIEGESIELGPPICI